MLAFLHYLDQIIEEQQFQEFSATMIQAIPEAEPIMRTYSQALREEGREEGREQSLRVFIADLLEVRGFALSFEQRARIQSCRSLETLQRWYAAAKTAPLDQPVDRLLELTDDDAR